MAPYTQQPYTTRIQPNHCGYTLVPARLAAKRKDYYLANPKTHQWSSGLVPMNGPQRNWMGWSKLLLMKKRLLLQKTSITQNIRMRSIAKMPILYFWNLPRLGGGSQISNNDHRTYSARNNKKQGTCPIFYFKRYTKNMRWIPQNKPRRPKIVPSTFMAMPYHGLSLQK